MRRAFWIAYEFKIETSTLASIENYEIEYFEQNLYTNEDNIYADAEK